MYLRSLKINNFRKFDNLKVNFTKGLNLLVGENDAGKTALIDSIKYVLHTQSFDYIRPSYEDFYLEQGQDETNRTEEFYIECTFEDLKPYEAKSFLEWLGFNENGDTFLKVWLIAKRRDRKIFYEVRAGADEEGNQLNGEARDYLRATYLKALRDAEGELTPKKGSRLSQILNNHEHFEDKEEHILKDIMKATNEEIEKYFSEEDGKDLLDDLNKYLENFSLASNELKSKFLMSGSSLKSILEKLALKLFNTEVSENNIQGLGSHNLLYIAAELLLLKKSGYAGLKLGLVEEIEAHLHPQTQIKLIEAIQKIGKNNDIQFIMTSHSPNLVSKVELENLIVLKNTNAYPMGSEYTKLDKGDYYFLERFLDSTKANLFFANGVILVEGDAENILIPTIAKQIGKNLSDYGVTIVNVGSIAFLRYSKIFLRQEEPKMSLPVAVITDVDVKPYESKVQVNDNGTDRDMTKSEVEEKRTQSILTKNKKYDEGVVKSFVAPYWTLEYTIALSCLSKLFHQAVYISWKIKDADGKNSYVYTVTKNKATLISEADAKYCQFLEDEKNIEEIAYEIYQKTLLDKQVSKAVVAQIFAQLLDETDLILYDIRNDVQFKYLVDAIDYVTTGR